MLLGRSNSTGVSIDDNNNTNPDDEPDIRLSPMEAQDCATLDFLKLCHDAGVSLEF